MLINALSRPINQKTNTSHLMVNCASEDGVLVATAIPWCESHYGRSGITNRLLRHKLKGLQWAQGPCGRPWALMCEDCEAVKWGHMRILISLSQPVQNELPEDLVLGADEVRLAEGHPYAGPDVLLPQPPLSPPRVGAQWDDRLTEASRFSIIQHLLRHRLRQLQLLRRHLHSFLPLPPVSPHHQH